MQVVYLRLKLNRKWTEIPWAYFNLNHSLNFVAICWTKLPSTCINISIITLLITKKSPIWFKRNILVCLFDSGNILHTVYKMIVANFNIALFPKLINSKFSDILTKKRKWHSVCIWTKLKKTTTTHRFVQNFKIKFAFQFS